MRAMLIALGLVFVALSAATAIYVLPWGEEIIAGSPEHALDQLVLLQVRTMWLVASAAVFLCGAGLLLAGALRANDRD